MSDAVLLLEHHAIFAANTLSLEPVGYSLCSVVHFAPTKGDVAFDKTWVGRPPCAMDSDDVGEGFNFCICHDAILGHPNGVS